jgi:hypothetical protein
MRGKLNDISQHFSVKQSFHPKHPSASSGIGLHFSSTWRDNKNLLNPKDRSVSETQGYLKLYL